MDQSCQFAGSTNEKEVILAHLSEIISGEHFGSVIDIGAGDGPLAIPVSKMVNEYTAIERNPASAERLRNAGLTVIEAVFPNGIQLSQADLVLISHVISFDEGNHKELTAGGWDLVAPRGSLVVVTHRGQHNNSAHELTTLRRDRLSRYPQIYEDICATLRAIGNASFTDIKASIETPDVEEMFSALEFIASNGRDEDIEAYHMDRERIIELIRREYSTDDGCNFPLEQVLIEVRKDPVTRTALC